MSDVKRYEAVHLRYEENNIRYGEGCEVEVVLASDYAALEDELAKLRAGQEPVAYITGQFAGRCVIEAINRAAVLPTGMALYATPQPSAVPDAITMADVMRAWEYAEDHPHKYLRGTTNWCAAVAHSLNKQRASAPTTAQGDGWIPVSERLPDVAQEVIVNSEFDGITAGFLDSYGEWYSPNSDYKLTRVVAWQPLPAPPAIAAAQEGGKV